MCKIYNYECLAQLHGLARGIDEMRGALEKEYLRCMAVSPRLLGMEKRVDELVAKYMRLALWKSG